ncbi:MAG: hypothetical protein QXD48_03650 [Candidatus Aenigmatarchaeota archaeon]
MKKKIDKVFIPNDERKKPKSYKNSIGVNTSYNGGTVKKVQYFVDRHGVVHFSREACLDAEEGYK